MADIVIYHDYIPRKENGDLVFHGYAWTSDQEGDEDQIEWEVAVNFSATVSAINIAIKDAAVAAAGVKGFTVDALDKKTLMGGAVGIV